ncbi:MAG: serine/threonine protein kinase [Sandaracinus sp.]|nr:serine/threonine protein kinase [Sandaracinus sp.]
MARDLNGRWLDERSATMAAPESRVRPANDVPGPGDLPPRLRLVERIGAGGMGEVWRARDEVLGRDVAVKLLRPGRSSPKLCERLEREARALARLHHPAIVTIHDIGRDGEGFPFLVMELLQGEDLGQLLERLGRIPAISAVRLILPVIDALHLAHQHSVVHRDLKPENVFLAESPYEDVRRPKLLDFGIAGLGSGSGLTAEIIGTPEYMAPEQLDMSRTVGPEADQWAAAMTLVTAIQGRPCFVGENLPAIFEQVRTAPLPFPRDGSMDGALFRVLARATRKDPAERFPSMAELAAALREWLRSQKKPETGPTSPLAITRPEPAGDSGRTPAAPPVASGPQHRPAPPRSAVAERRSSRPPSSLDAAIRASFTPEKI